MPKKTQVTTPVPSVLRVVDALSAVLTFATVVCSYRVYTALPDTANVPMQFRFGGEIGWSWESKHAFLMYPLLSLVIGVALPLYTSRAKMNHPVKLTGGRHTAANEVLTFGFMHLTYIASNGIMLGIVTTSVVDASAGTFGPVEPWVVQAPLSFIVGIALMYFYSCFVVIPTCLGTATPDKEE